MDKKLQSVWVLLDDDKLIADMKVDKNYATEIAIRTGRRIVEYVPKSDISTESTHKGYCHICKKPNAEPGEWFCSAGHNGPNFQASMSEDRIREIAREEISKMRWETRTYVDGPWHRVDDFRIVPGDK